MRKVKKESVKHYVSPDYKLNILGGEKCRKIDVYARRIME